MKKVLFYNGSLRMGGIERVLVEVLQNIDTQKFKIDLIIEDGLKETNVFENDIPQEINIKYLISEETMKISNYHREKKKNFYHKVIYNYMMFRKKQEKRNSIKNLFKDNEYDVVIDYDMGLSKEIDLVRAKKKVAWVHASIKNWYEKPDRIKRLGERLTKYDKIIVICDDMKKEVEELYPFLKDKIERIYNPFNFKRIKDMSLEKIELPQESYFVSVMRLTTHQKDFDTLIKAFKILKEKGIDEKLYILGGGPDKKKIETMIKSEGLQNQVILVGSVKNPYPWIKNAKAMIHSSKYEGFGLVLVEAMICETMVISSDCPTGPREVLDDGKCGILIPLADYQRMAGEIENIIKNSELQQNYKQKSKEYVAKFSTETIMREYENLIFEETGDKE